MEAVIYTVNFLLKNSPNSLTFVFKAFKNADELYKKGLSLIKTMESLECEDDYETRGVIDMSSISAVTFGDYEKDMNKNGEMQIIQAKSQLRTQSLAKSDVGLQMASSLINPRQ